MLVILFGEGKTDYGQPIPGGWQEGPIQNIIRQACAGISVDFVCIEKGEIAKIPLQRRHAEEIKGKGSVSFKLCIIARQRNINNVICYSDADREQCTRNDKLHLSRRHGSVRREIMSGFVSFGDERIIGIAMVPLTMIECWLLSDIVAYKHSFKHCPDNFTLPREPEFLWGSKHDPSSDYPKNVINRKLEECSYSGDICDAFMLLSSQMDIETVRQNCPNSFQVFLNDIASLKVAL